MIVALGFCQKDAAAARDMLLWCEQLGDCRDFDALLVTDPSTQWSESVAVMEQAAKVFRAVSIETTEKSVTTWPQGANALFREAAVYANKAAQPFLWTEPDCIPLRSGWCGAIDDEYRKCGASYFGRVYRSNNPALPDLILSGTAVYHPETAERFAKELSGDIPFDVALSKSIAASATNTDLIQWFWGQPDLAPTFAMAKTPGCPVNTFTPQQLEPQAVLFHRNKDGTLIRCLRELSGISRADDFVVLFSFTRHDVTALAKLMEWIVEVGTPRTHDALLWYESGTEANWVERIAHSAKRCFNSVFRGSYRDPELGPNGAWMSAARQMQTMRRPWLWMEPDAVPTTEGWLRTLQVRYRQQQKPFMGPVVPHFGHMNGTGIYPWNTPAMCPRTMSESARTGWAWDMTLKPEMIHLCYDCSDLYQHAWVESEGALKPYGDGVVPTFPTRQSLARLQPSTVIFHRNKDLTLIDRLREARGSA